MKEEQIRAKLEALVSKRDDLNSQISDLKDQLPRSGKAYGDPLCIMEED